MSITWKLSEIRDKVRTLTGKPSTSQVSDSDINDKINEFYQNKFPFDVESEKLEGYYTVTMSPTDSGEYSIPATVLLLSQPVWIDGQEIEFTRDRQWFYQNYPKNTSSAYIIDDDGAGLVIGTSSTRKVKNSAFYYSISGYSYYKASTETSLSGDNIPQGKYGAWRLEINTSGSISIVEASDNATGYTTPAKAIEGLSSESSSKACMGYVTATNSGGVFVPGSTLMDAANVTATFTDGFHSVRNIPLMVLEYNDTLYSMPKPNDWMELKAPYILKPTAMTNDTDIPLDVMWGEALAYGASIEILLSERRTGLAQEIKPVYDYCISKINEKYTKKQQPRRVKASFL